MHQVSTVKQKQQIAMVCMHMSIMSRQVHLKCKYIINTCNNAVVSENKYTCATDVKQKKFSSL